MTRDQLITHVALPALVLIPLLGVTAVRVIPRALPIGGLPSQARPNVRDAAILKSRVDALMTRELVRGALYRPTPSSPGGRRLDLALARPVRVATYLIEPAHGPAPLMMPLPAPAGLLVPPGGEWGA